MEAEACAYDELEDRKLLINSDREIQVTEDISWQVVEVGAPGYLVSDLLILLGRVPL